MSCAQIPQAKTELRKMFKLICKKSWSDSASDALDAFVSKRLQHVLCDADQDWNHSGQTALMAEFGELITRIDCVSETEVTAGTVNTEAGEVEKKYKDYVPASLQLGCGDKDKVKAEYDELFDRVCDEDFDEIREVLDEVFRRTLEEAMCRQCKPMVWNDEARHYVLPKLAELAKRIERKPSGTTSPDIALEIAECVIEKYYQRFRKMGVVEWCKGWRAEDNSPCPPATDPAHPGS